LGGTRSCPKESNHKNGVVMCHHALPWARLPICSITSAHVQGNYDRVTQSMTFVEKSKLLPQLCPSLSIQL